MLQDTTITPLDNIYYVHYMCMQHSIENVCNLFFKESHEGPQLNEVILVGTDNSE